MVLAKNSICDFGWEAHDFALKGVDGKIWTLGDVRGPKGTLIIFICNHCPYVKASIAIVIYGSRALSAAMQSAIAGTSCFASRVGSFFLQTPARRFPQIPTYP